MAVAAPFYDRKDYPMSAFRGTEWVENMLEGRPERMRRILGVNPHVFLQLLHVLEKVGCSDTPTASLDEQLAIFLYTCVTGLPTSHVSERFQRSCATISDCFSSMLLTFSTAPFYTAYVRLPDKSDPIPPEILTNPKFSPFFHGAIGALDCTHIRCSPPAGDRDRWVNRKGLYTQNCLMACSFDMRFLYVSSGWEGSTADAMIYHSARRTDFRIPPGRYYFADAGFGLSDELLVPYRGGRYHLKEESKSAVNSPQNKEELFNLRHASARNVIERAFGVLKNRFRILLLPSEYGMDIQILVPYALCALHNFIHRHDCSDILDFDQDIDGLLERKHLKINFGELAVGPVSRKARKQASKRRDGGAQAIWYPYQSKRNHRC